MMGALAPRSGGPDAATEPFPPDGGQLAGRAHLRTRVVGSERRCGARLPVTRAARPGFSASSLPGSPASSVAEPPGPSPPDRSPRSTARPHVAAGGLALAAGLRSSDTRPRNPGAVDL